jgi:hypothetical protein
MNRFLSLCVTVFFVLSVNAGAQVFNHLSLGAGLGTDGVSLELAAPLGGHVDVVAGYGMGFGLIGYTVKDFSVSDPSTGGMATAPLRLGLGMSDARLLFNIYPGDGGFHFTVGAYLGSSRIIRGQITNMPGTYNTAGIEVDDYLVRAKNGTLDVDLCAPGFGGSSFSVRPYVGVGFGRAVDEDKTVTFSVDLGVQYQGKPGVWAEGVGLTGRTRYVQITEKQIKEMSKFDDYGKYMMFWPTLTFHLYVKLF